MSQQPPPPSRAQRVADALARAHREAHPELNPEAQPSPEEVEQQRREDVGAATLYTALYGRPPEEES